MASRLAPAAIATSFGPSMEEAPMSKRSPTDDEHVVPSCNASTACISPRDAIFSRCASSSLSTPTTTPRAAPSPTKAAPSAATSTFGDVRQAAREHELSDFAPATTTTTTTTAAEAASAEAPAAPLRAPFAQKEEHLHRPAMAPAAPCAEEPAPSAEAAPSVEAAGGFALRKHWARTALDEDAPFVMTTSQAAPSMLTTTTAAAAPMTSASQHAAPERGVEAAPPRAPAAAQWRSEARASDFDALGAPAGAGEGHEDEEEKEAESPKASFGRRRQLVRGLADAPPSAAAAPPCGQAVLQASAAAAAGRRRVQAACLVVGAFEMEEQMLLC